MWCVPRFPDLSGAAVAVAVAVAPLQAQGLPMGSQVPCAVPMSWTVSTVDPRFDLTESRALAAAREAGSLWERAVGADLFRFDADAGFPVSFHYDERQAAVEDRRERERELDAERMAIEERRAELEEASREYESMIEEYRRDTREHGRAVRSYNDDMTRLSREREVPASVQREMERRRQELDRTARELQERERSLDRRGESMRADVDRFNERVERIAARERSFARDFPASTAQSGRYDETVSLQGGGPVALTRRIQIYQFTSHDDLVLVLAHELGHALGLGHAPGGGAVMSEVIVSGTGATPVGGITPVDLRIFSERCPDLVESGI